VSIFLVASCSIAQFSFWKLPAARLSHHLRGTGNFANIGGRLLGTMFAWVTTTLAITPGRFAPKLAYTAAASAWFTS
jgi:hypothetical protein